MKARLEEAVDEDADITEALNELREQLQQSKKEKLSHMQLLEQAERTLASELGTTSGTADVDGVAPMGAAGDGDGARGGTAGSGAESAPVDEGTLRFARTVSALWKKLEASSIEKLNVGQQEALGVKDLLRLSNEQIEQVASELKRATSSTVLHGEVSSLLCDLFTDASSSRRRLNDFTEGLLVQTAQRLDVFKAQYQQARGS